MKDLGMRLQTRSHSSSPPMIIICPVVIKHFSTQESYVYPRYISWGGLENRLFYILYIGNTVLPTEDVYAGLSAEALDSVWTENDLARLAQYMTTWESYSTFLGLVESEEEEIKRDNHKYAVQKYKMLLRWKKKSKEAATYHQLIRLSLRLEDMEMAYKVREIMLNPQIAPDIDNSELEQYREYLQLQYEKLPHPGLLPDQWPHGKVKSPVYIDREMAEIPDEQSDESDALEKGNRQPVALHELFEQEIQEPNPGKCPQKIIIKGNPGSGKTTLTWQASKQWSKGTIFQNFRLFLSISLRSPRVQQASCLADLIPHPDQRQRIAIAEAISVSNGKQVCFWFDSWDDLPQDIQRESFIAHFICGDQSGEFLPECSIVITTRPETEYLGESFGFEFEICDLSTEQANEIIVQSTAGTAHDPELLIDHIRSNVELLSFCSLPINIVILVHLFFSFGSELPNTQTKLFECLVLNLLLRNLQMRWKHSIKTLRKFKGLPESPRECFDSLCLLAFNGTVKTRTIFTSSDFSPQVPISLATLGLMRVVPKIDAFGVEEELSFVHITLQEFLAAVHLSTLSNDEQVKVVKELVDARKHLPMITFFAGLTQFSNKDVFFIIEETCREKHYELDNCGSTTLKIRNTDHALFMIVNCIYEAQSAELCRFVQPKGGPCNLLDLSYWASPEIWFMRHMQLLGYFLAHYCQITRCVLAFRTHFFEHHPKGIKLLIHQVKSSWKSGVARQAGSELAMDPLFKFFSGVDVVRGYNKVLSPEDHLLQKASPLVIHIDNWDSDVVKGFCELVRDTDVVGVFALKFFYMGNFLSGIRPDSSPDDTANQCAIMKELVETMSRSYDCKSRDRGCKELCLTFVQLNKKMVVYFEYYAVLLLLYSKHLEFICFHSFFEPSLSNYSIFAAALQYARITYLDLSDNDDLSDTIVHNISRAIRHNGTLMRVNFTRSLTSSQLSIVLLGINVFSQLHAVYTSLEPSVQHQRVVSQINWYRSNPFNPPSFRFPYFQLICP